MPPLSTAGYDMELQMRYDTPAASAASHTALACRVSISRELPWYCVVVRKNSVSTPSSAGLSVSGESMSAAASEAPCAARSAILGLEVERAMARTL